MDNIQKSFFNLKKDLKYRLGGKKRAPDRAGDDAVVSGPNEEGTGTSTDISLVRSRDSSPQLAPVPADEGHRDPQRKESDVDEKEAGHGDSRLAAGSELSREDKQVYSPPVTSILFEQELDDASAVPDHTRKPNYDENAESNTMASEKKSSWKSTAHATAKLLLRGVRDSADVFGPLKFVVRGLCFILENCEIWYSLAHTVTTLTGAPTHERERADDRVVGTAGEGLLKDVARGLIYMHDHEMAHGDLKGANILIGQDRYARLADFGLHTALSDPANPTPLGSYTAGGTIPWMSPELLTWNQTCSKNNRPTKQSDYYAVGMVIYGVLCGQAPFAPLCQFAVMWKIVGGERRERPGGVEGTRFTENLWKMLNRCWVTRSESWPNSSEVLECLEQVSRDTKPPS